MVDILKPLNISDILINDIVFAAPKIKKDKKIIPLKYKDSDKFVFELPQLLYKNSIEHYDDYSEIELLLEGKNKEHVSELITFLNALENKIKSDAAANTHDWFNKSIEHINLQRIIRYSNTYNIGSVKLKILKSNEFETNITFDNNKISKTELPCNSFCKSIIECYALWINSNNDFGIFLRPILLNFSVVKKLNYNYNFNEDDSDDIYIPDTDINNNMFMKIMHPSNSQEINNDLKEFKNNLYKNRENNIEEESEMVDSSSSDKK
jgi:hypothetical protein